MAEYKLKLNSKDRFKVKTCPCGKSNNDGKFVPYENLYNSGYCHSCSKTFLPLSQSQANSDLVLRIPRKKIIKTHFIDPHYLSKSLRMNRPNNLIYFLKHQFGYEVANYLIDLYKIGTSKHWTGASIFWYIDRFDNLTTGKIMLFDEKSGRRIKEPFNHITWVHKKLNISNECINICLFGENLMNLYVNKPIAIVESEKSAIISSIYFPEFIWMASGGISNLTFDKIKVLKGRKVVLFPDLGAYELWVKKADSFKSFINITVSDYLEKNASSHEREKKYDIADYLILFNK